MIIDTDKLDLAALAANELPFGEMPDELALQLVAAHRRGMQVEYEHGRLWEGIEKPSWYLNHTYRLSPACLPQPDWVDWSVLAPQWQFMARDEDGAVWVFTQEPQKVTDHWAVLLHARCVTNLFTPAHLRIGNLPWDQSLITRPEGV